MTNKEGAKVADMTRALNVILAKDQDGNDDSVNLTPRERNWIDNARIQGLELLRSRVQNAEAAINQADAWVSTAEQECFDFGTPRQDGDPGSDGSLPPTERTYDEPELDGLEPAAFDRNAGIPVDVRAGLRQALSDGSGPKKACQDVAKLTGLEYAEVRDHFEALERNGKIRSEAGTNGKTGKTSYHWVPDDSDSFLEVAPDGTVSSETPAGVSF